MGLTHSRLVSYRLPQFSLAVSTAYTRGGKPERGRTCRGRLMAEGEPVTRTETELVSTLGTNLVCTMWAAGTGSSQTCSNSGILEVRLKPDLPYLKYFGHA